MGVNLLKMIKFVLDLQLEPNVSSEISDWQWLL